MLQLAGVVNCVTADALVAPTIRKTAAMIAPHPYVWKIVTFSLPTSLLTEGRIVPPSGNYARASTKTRGEPTTRVTSTQTRVTSTPTRNVEDVVTSSCV